MTSGRGIDAEPCTARRPNEALGIAGLGCTSVMQTRRCACCSAVSGGCTARCGWCPAAEAASDGGEWWRGLCMAKGLLLTYNCMTKTDNHLFILCIYRNLLSTYTLAPEHRSLYSTIHTWSLFVLMFPSSGRRPTRPARRWPRTPWRRQCWAGAWRRRCCAWCGGDSTTSFADPARCRGARLFTAPPLAW